MRAQIDGISFDAYEIHMGVTTTPADCEPFAIVNGEPEGIRSGRCFGTYLHDALRCDTVLKHSVCRRCNAFHLTTSSRIGSRRMQT